uniref:Protein phosphatase 1 regulatory subunit 7-like n=1 Tax=Saccoglossus kowalevskii TaxID=10224 RepID=A0ABM0GZA8_SACKO|nr:PREDICTED: protein phosphatase 1 regulatory subunit 7-like [Saccoglossus kowalevskii]
MSAKTRSPFSAQNSRSPSKPSGSAKYQRKTPPSVRNHVHSATNGRVASTRNKTVSKEHNDSDTEQDVLMINIPSAGDVMRERESNAVTCEIDPQKILQQSGEISYQNIYECNLHASNIGRINNLEKFIKLRILDLSCNHIKHIENLDRNTDLRELKLYGNQIAEIQNINGCRELCNLLLQHNRIKTLGKGLSCLRNLKMMRLDNNQISRIESREITSCGHLTYLDISNNRIDNLVSFNCLQNLIELYASGNRIQSISDLSRCRKLQDLDVSNNRLTDISGLKGLPNLMNLNVANNSLTNDRLKAVGKLQCGLCKISNLVELFISGNPFAAEGGEKQSYIHELRTLLPKLEILDGVPMRRITQRSAPVMRPMSATSAVSSRQVENQIRSVEQDIVSFESSLASRFENLRTTVDTLPLEAPSRLGNDSDVSSRPGTSSGRCSVRSRIFQAKAFADEHF